MRRSIPLAGAAMFVALSCNENLPTGPQTFAAQLSITVSHDTFVVGDSSVAQAQAIDAAGNRIQSLTFTWSSTDSGVVGLASPGNPDTSNGRAQKTGRPANRTRRRVGRARRPAIRLARRRRATRRSSWAASEFSRPTIPRSRQSTIRELRSRRAWCGSTARSCPAPARGFVGCTQGSHTATVAQGDTLRYVARSNGPDTLIATSDFCLAGAKCADTVIARVSQSLTLPPLDTSLAVVELQRFVEPECHAGGSSRNRTCGHLDTFRPGVACGFRGRSRRPRRRLG